MMRVGHIGYFGWGNYGDELMLETWREHFVDRAAQETVHTLLHRPYFEEPAVRVAERFDVLIIGGGDLIQPDSISTLYWNRAWLTRPVVIAGVGAALERQRQRPDVASRLAAFMSHENVRMIGVRDSGTQNWLSHVVRPSRKITTGADLAFAATIPSARRTRNAVAVVLRKSPSTDDVTTVRRLQRVCAGHGTRVELLVLATKQQRDRETAELGRAFGATFPVITCSTTTEITRQLSEYRGLVTAKFHGAVMAARMGIPTLSMRRTHKLTALAQSLGDALLTVHPSALDDRGLWDALTRTVPMDAVNRLEEMSVQHCKEAVRAAMRRSQGDES